MDTNYYYDSGAYTNHNIDECQSQQYVNKYGVATHKS